MPGDDGEPLVDFRAGQAEVGALALIAGIILLVRKPRQDTRTAPEPEFAAEGPDAVGGPGAW